MATPVTYLEEADVWSAFSRQSQPRRVESTQRLNATRRPLVGLLSQTVVSSPTVQFVLPARLRSKDHNDVVFVGERRLQVKEVVPGFGLEDVAVKSDFDANIMAAKAVNVCTRLAWETQMRLGGGNSTATADTTIHERLVPPQIMILTLSSRELVFLYHAVTDHGSFVQSRRPLPSHFKSSESFGRHIAVDPRSRAVAVAAFSDYFGIFMLKPLPVLQSQMAKKQLDPIAEERFCRVDGDILFMEFLYPKHEDGDKLALLLLVSKEQNTYAVCYEWDANQKLREVTPRLTRRQLPLEYRLPSILVPLTKASSFLVVSTTSMAIYDMVGHTKQPSRYPIPVQDCEAQRTPLWARWARPTRDWLYKQAHDDIYLCREDGRVFYLAIGSEGEIEHRSYLGALGCDVDSAFDIIDVGHEGGDLILAAGNMGDGGLFVQNARDCPRCVQRFLNWGPITDAVVVRPISRSPLISDTDGDRLFACSASTVGRGSVVEFRHGIEAQIGLLIAQDELSSTRDIWAMTDSINGVYILTSDPVSSLLIYLPHDFGDEICAVSETESGLDFATQTLAVGCTQSGIIIQVTKKAIHLGAPHDPSLRFRFDYNANEDVIGAAVNQPTSLITTAVRSHSEIYLRLARVDSYDGQVRLSDVGGLLKIDYEPVCLSIEDFGFASFIIVGTSDGKIAIYRIEENTFTFSSDYAVDVGGSDDISRAVETVARISTRTDDSLGRTTFFCGLRSGILVPFEIEFDADNSTMELKQRTPRRLGQTSIRLLGRKEFAMLTCGQGFWRVSHTPDSELSEYDIEKIWITDQNNPAYNQKSIDAFTLLNMPPASNLDGICGSLFCVTEGQLLICALDHKAKTVPRRISLPGSASKLTYSSHLQSLIVAYSTTVLDTSVDPIRRYTRSYIDFVDPNLQRPGIGPPSPFAEEGEESSLWRPHTVAGEKITCILDWMPERGDEKYHWVVIGTARKHQRDKGRVVFLRAARNPTNSSHIECVTKHVHHFEGPVYAIAPYGGFTLMVATGYDIVPLVPKFSETRWEQARFSLLSPAVSITAHEPYLYLSTARESLVVLKVSDNKLALHAHDRAKREGLSHFHMRGEPNLTVSSSRGGTVSILTEVGVAGNDRLMPAALAEAHLPLSATKLLRVSGTLYGTTLDGAIYRFAKLGEKEWHLLRFLQILSTRDPAICPFASKRKRRLNPTDIEMLVPGKKPSHMHIDGDILGRLVIRGTDHLRQMLAADNNGSQETLQEASPSETGRILERFSELSEALLGTSTDPVRDVMGWLRNLLHRGLSV